MQSINEIEEFKKTTIQELLEIFADEVKICDEFRRISNNNLSLTIGQALHNIKHSEQEKKLLIGLLRVMKMAVDERKTA